MSNPGEAQYDAEIERKLRTPVLDPPPEFKPQVPLELLKTIASYETRDRNIVLPMLEAWSISEQLQKWYVHHLMAHNQAIRELERENLDRRDHWKTTSLWLLAVVVAALIGALAVKFIHP